MTDETTTVEAPTGVLSVNCTHEDTLERIEMAFDFKATVADALESFGEATVLYYWQVGARKALRDRLYALAHRGNTKEGSEPANIPTVEEILATLQDWEPKPGSTRQKKSDEEKAIENFDKMSPDAQTALIEKLQALQS